MTAPTDAAPVYARTVPGWPHLEAVRCDYPAAGHHTPIPCGAEHRDRDTTTFRALRGSAQRAGWHLDALGRWACPACQMGGDYRTLYPVTIWAAYADGDIGHAEHELFRDVLDTARHGRHRRTGAA